MCHSEYPPEDPFESDVRRLLKVCRKIIDGATDTETIDELDSVVDEIENHFEDTDPRSMGWVGDDGLP